MLRFLISLVALLGVASMSAQMTPRSVVTTAPEKVLLTIDASTLLDMLDYYENGVARTVRNKMGEDAVITEMTGSTVTIATGEAHSITFAILPYGKSSVIMVIDRVDTPDTDAVISFYDSRWKPLDSRKLLRTPALADWVGKVSAERMREIENALPFLMADAQYNPDTATLSFTPQTSGYVSVENADKVKEALAPRLDYVWSGKSFKPVKR
ncbi:MAG: DUF3256 family protein [Muribaculaceae bacterium]|nr:DUF3256 family protein [Muribaculaceae bacterium]MDE6345956.1 DUF3256 family protein [Muribaculaceae bacterium]